MTSLARMALATTAGLALATTGGALASAQGPAAGSAARRARQGALANVSASLFLPTRASRQIDTVYLDLVAGVELWELLGVDLYAGITVVAASGFVLQPDELLADRRYDTSVAGAGPTFLFRVEPLRIEGLSVAADVTGSLLLFSARFPPGGDVYDFAWRIGGTLGYALTAALRVELSVRWMHTSNGQGIGPFNPAYEGVGGYLGTQTTL